MSSPAVATTPDIEALIASGAPVAIGVSGGKDSQAAALATFDHLNAAGHRGPRVLIHSDLGSVEWDDSLPTCQRLAAHLNCELIVVRRKAGGMVERWESRWISSVRRYASLETVTLLLPWSTPSMRFYTSELKAHVIGAELRRRFKGSMIINVDTITETDRFESVYCAVLPEAQAFGLADGLMTGNCIMSSMADLKAAAGAAESLELYRHLVSLEIRSTFGFQGAQWLADIAPRLLTPAMSGDVDCAKQKAAARVTLEKRITTEMLYVKGWPTRMLTDEEAGILADVRAQVSTLLGIEAQYLDVPSIHHRYAELIAANEARVSEAA